MTLQAIANLITLTTFLTIAVGFALAWRKVR
jgi:hypothetical protein